MNYWKECITEAIEEAGIAATEAQIESISKFVSGAHEQYGMAHGHDCIPNPLKLENDRLEKALESERTKVVCPDCGGNGSIYSEFGTRSSWSSCARCRATGKVSPY